MASGNIAMSPEEAITYGNQIIENATSYGTEVQKIYGIVDDLKTAWTGSSAQRFTQNIENFRQDYEKFGELIGQFGELLVAIGKEYQNLEENL